MKEGWEIKRLDDACEVEYGTRVVRKRDGGTIYPVYGGGGATFFMDTFNREDCMVVARFAMSEQCTRFVSGKFFLNDSGLTVKPKNDSEILPDFLNLQVHFLNDHIYSLSRGTAQRNLDVPKFRNIKIIYPKSLPEQQRIVSILDKAFSAIEQSRNNAKQNLQNAKELFESYLQGVFDPSTSSRQRNGDDWEMKTLKDLTIKIGSGATPRGGQKNYKSEGISLVRSMNVHDSEFRERNLAFIDEKQAKELNGVILQEKDVLLNITGASVARCCVVPTEYLPARVNQHVSIIRPKKEILDPRFLNLLLTSKPYKDQLLLTGEQGATRQAITKAQIETFKILLPKLEEQQSIVRQLDTLRAETQKLEAVYQKKIADLEELKKSILQKAFAGELTSAVSESVSVTIGTPLQKAEGISPTDLQAGITAFALKKHIEKNKQHSFHRVKAEKIVHISEYILNVDLNRNPVKDAAGPNDFRHLQKIESRAKKAGFYSVHKNGDRYDYKQGNSFNKIIQKAQERLGDKADILSQIIDILAPMSTQQAEIVATIYAAWNNLLLLGIEFTDADIVIEARENWHKNKLKIERNKFFKALEWMKKNELLIPKGNGKLVAHKYIIKT